MRVPGGSGDRDLSVDIAVAAGVLLAVGFGIGYGFRALLCDAAAHSTRARQAARGWGYGRSDFSVFGVPVLVVCETGAELLKLGVLWRVGCNHI